MTSHEPLDSIRAHRWFWLFSFDVTAWLASVWLSTWARRDFQVTDVRLASVFEYALLPAFVYLALAGLVGLHRGRARVATVGEMLLYGSVATLSGASGFVVNITAHPPIVPRSVPLTSTFLAIVIMGFGRVTWRAVDDQRRLGPLAADSLPVMVLGAGEAGRQLVRSMLANRPCAYRPVALLDDDPLKRHLKVNGIPVTGTSNDLTRVARSTGACVLVVAVPSMDAARIRQVSDAALSAGIAVKVLPGLSDLLGSRVGIGDVRDLNLVDLLGRRQIDTDLTAISGSLTGQRVLVTGAGGSIGSELCRQIRTWNPAELIMLDRDESALHAVQLSVTGRALLDTADVVLADIRDAEAIQRIFQLRRPDVVFHAAALKHLPMLEQFPAEAFKTNVLGTLNVLEAARAIEVACFVNISTDKAADPISVLGFSKRLAERLTAYVADDAGGRFLSVRFGNVLGSRGSVLTSFTAQIARGGPITVTHPEMRRYFMTVQEAVQLVLQAASIGGRGEALVLDMGEPVSIEKVARQLMQLAGVDLQIEYTGLRPGEKLTECMRGSDERDSRPLHPLISHVIVPPLSPHELLSINTSSHPSDLVRSLADSCTRAQDHQSL